MDTDEIVATARDSAAVVATCETEQKNAALEAMAHKLGERRQDLIEANQKDIEAARESGTPGNLLDRLGFGDAKIDSRIGSLQKLKNLADPVGQTFRAEKRPNGLEVARMRVPLGVILMIYEARPHVTVNAGAFCLKSGNAAILRGGSEAERCNALLGELWRESLREADLPVDPEVRESCSFLGLDPLYLANEGKLICVVPSNRTEEALEVLTRHGVGENAACIGEVGGSSRGRVILETGIGGRRLLQMLEGEQLPRIC